MKKIIKIDIQNAKTGMQLATNAVDVQGVCLLSVGSVLTGENIGSLKKRNINQISVYKNEILNSEQSHELIMDIKNELDYSFKYLEEIPVMNELKQVFYKFRTKDIADNND